MSEIQRNIHKRQDKLLVATAPLCGCFGCHMSLLDIDLKLLDLIEVVEFNKSPLNDISRNTTTIATAPRAIASVRIVQPQR